VAPARNRLALLPDRQCPHNNADVVAFVGRAGPLARLTAAYQALPHRRAAGLRWSWLPAKPALARQPWMLANTAAERARKAVTARIRDAIRRITDAHPELGAHLDRTVRTGTTCRYEPSQRD
jgi:hypothetical protein